MMPRTRAEAEKMRYGEYRPALVFGWGFDRFKCAWAVRGYLRHQIEHQCSRKPGHGPDKLYCKQHARMVDDEIMREPDYADMGGHT